MNSRPAPPGWLLLGWMPMPLIAVAGRWHWTGTQYVWAAAAPARATPRRWVPATWTPTPLGWHYRPAHWE